ncbi:hypothetical protein AAT17_07935 [Nonlabens sp. MIC269]|uniref:DUF58 domain-containing protein n=1 Tax=Nonlabens sp. MIC269 TaxID=1476901 RepID=UPI00071F2DFD|nr:DUF58 domain-containing protein [Nonlabens sp. MIC269]ALM21160.1 hypothetical protein AAT17_07935 [Nonlabens sp. MIC269]
MNTQELLKKVRKIEIKTRRLSDAVFGGEYHSAFKGRGMTFSEVRQYQFGDDVRNIDWNVTARYNEPYIKVFEEERELTLMLVVDVSSSTLFGTQNQIKKEIITELCATLAFSALQNNDKVGLLLFSDQVELFVPPKKGKSHILRIIRELLEFKPEHKKTDVSGALKYMAGVLKKKAIVFVLSDFMSDDYMKTLQIIGRKHDVTGVRIYDKHEQELPKIGLVQFKDLETGKNLFINTNSSKTRSEYAAHHIEKAAYFKNAFTRSDAGAIDLETREDYSKKLLGYFKAR